VTALVLMVAWLSLAALVTPRGTRAIWRLRPVAQAVVLLGVLVGMVAVPASALTVTLARGLGTVGGPGSFYRRCGRLVVAIVSEPWKRPELSASLVALAALAGAIALGAVSGWRSQRSAARLARRPAGGPIVVDSPAPVAFTAGLLRPRVVVSRGLLDSLSAEWRSVLLAHEEAHRRGRHPLLIFVAESVARGLPLPATRRAADALRLALEALADDHASQRTGDEGLVAEAVAGIALASVSALPGFEGDEVRRVRRLLDPPKPASRLTTPGMMLGLLVLLVFAGGHALHCGRLSIEALRVSGCRVDSVSGP
jgi:bla regulator protein blaR1